MPTREIPREDWDAFLDSFSRKHAGWLSTIEVLGSGSGAQVEAREQPLSGIAAELKGGSRDLISILVGDDDHGRTCHPRTRSYAPEGDGRGAHEALQIESESGVTTLLHFRATVPLQLLDGHASR